MTRVTNKIGSLIIVASAVALLAGCAAAVVGGAAVGGAAIAHDRRTTGTIVEDQAIELKIHDAIRNDSELKEGTHINVTSFNGVVLLSGEVPTKGQQARASKLAGEVEKVRRVHNELTIAAPSSAMSRSSDSLLTAKVKTQLLSEEDVAVGHIKVVTENGVVYLMGLVNRAEADKATAVARQIGGVQKVVRIFEYVD